MLPQHDYAQGSILEKGWFVVLIIGIAVVVGVVTWYALSHPDQIAHWVSPDPERQRVEKPVVRSSSATTD